MAVAFSEPNNRRISRRRVRKEFVIKPYSYEGLQSLKKEMQ